MKPYHEKVYDVARRDKEYRADVKASPDDFPIFTSDTLRKGIWAAGYAGWVLGRHGKEELVRRSAEWKLL